MPRKPRYRQRVEDAAYHVLNRGHKRETIFAHDDDKAAFLTLLSRCRTAAAHSNRFDLRKRTEEPISS